ncbi:MAG: hypothetical protein JWN93_384 [Hyphomicrobiales bacterium]|nr:hypothetical protein [Hyphomicrobiales bacterium]
MRASPAGATRALTAAAVLLACAAGTRAQSLVTTLSTDLVPILSNFTGERIAVFGVVEPGAAPRPKAGWDVVVTVRGPRGAVTVRRKESWGPLWLNLDQRRYIAIPAFISVLSNRPLDLIAQAEVRDDLRLGIEPLIPSQTAARAANDPRFREALQRLREKQGLFSESAEQVRFISPNVFQAQIDLPGTAPLGNYDVEVALFSDGARVTKSNLGFRVTKTAAEQWVADVAHQNSILYGIATALIAVLVGWLASLVFRRD